MEISEKELKPIKRPMWLNPKKQVSMSTITLPENHVVFPELIRRAATLRSVFADLQVRNYERIHVHAVCLLSPSRWAAPHVGSSQARVSGRNLLYASFWKAYGPVRAILTICSVISCFRAPRPSRIAPPHASCLPAALHARSVPYPRPPASCLGRMLSQPGCCAD